MGYRDELEPYDRLNPRSVPSIIAYSGFPLSTIFSLQLHIVNPIILRLNICIYRNRTIAI
uniref:Uncharacterized protein n=1 Tax=Heterorhabditis bacteriophora TaxID=37862 RepID=A0A1I7WH66_HETBA